MHSSIRMRRSLVVLVETRCSHEPRPICDDKTLGNTVNVMGLLRASSKVGVMGNTCSKRNEGQNRAHP